MVVAVVKRCGCGREYDARGWAALKRVGEQETFDETGRYVLELRNCPCGSTIGIEKKYPVNPNPNNAAQRG